MRYFLDAEFIEDGKTIDLISIGIVSEDGRELYLENADCDLSAASDWVKENVIPHLHRNLETYHESVWDRSAAVMPRSDIAAEVYAFCAPTSYGKPEFWGYYADYDWVVFCQLFGRMIDLPKGFPMFCRDIKQWCVELGDPELPKQSSTEHHALADARWNKQAFEFLRDLQVNTK